MSEPAIDAVLEEVRPVARLVDLDRSETASFQERHWVSWAKVGVDILALQLSLYVGHHIRYLFNPWWPAQISPVHYYTLVVSMLLLPIGYWMEGLYPGYGLLPEEKLRRHVRATFVVLLIIASWNFLDGDSGSSREMLFLTFVAALIIPPSLQTLMRILLIRFNCWGTPVVVLGAARTGAQVVEALLKDPAIGFRPVAAFDDDPAKAGKKLCGIPIIQGLLRANEFSDRIGYALVAMPGAGKELQIKLIRQLLFPHIIITPDLIGLRSLWVQTRSMGGIIGLDFHKNLLLRKNQLAKKLMDYCLSIPLFILSIPLLAVSAAWVMISGRGNPFYSQERECHYGKKFKVWKLRTMYHDAELRLHEHLTRSSEARKEWNRFFKLKNDPRILPYIGTFLRKTSLDELPQLWNVLRGEMSLVGPRPFPDYHLERFNADFRRLRCSVIPGMTGLWQVTARSDGDLTVQEALDTHYIRNWSIWLDIIILARTILIVLSGKGAC